MLKFCQKEQKNKNVWEKTKNKYYLSKIEISKKNNFRKHIKENHEHVAISEAQSEPGYV